MSTADGDAGAPPLVVAMVARPHGVTGVHTHVRQLVGYLQRAGRHVDVVTPHQWPGGSRLRRMVLLALFGVRVVLERVAGPVNVWWYRTSHELVLRLVLRRSLSGAGPCTVYAQCPVSARAALAARVGTHQRVVLAVHFRISQADEWANKGQVRRGGLVYRWIRQVEREVLPRVDGLVFVSDWARAAVRDWLPAVDRVPGVVVPNFVDRPPGAPAPARRGDLVTVGSLEPVKNHRFLVRVLAAARDLGHTYSLDVYGEGPERHGLAALADSLGVRDQVHFHGFRTDVQQCLPGHAAYVHASYSESSSLAIMEAMAVGLPVVSSNEGALGELFEEPAEGRFWALDDPLEAAKVLVELLESPAELRRAGAAAREKFLRDYDAEVVAPRLLAFLLGGTERSPAGPVAGLAG